MKKFGIGLLMLAVAAMVSSAVIAQPPGGGDRPRDGERRGPEGGRGRGDGPPPRRDGRGDAPPRHGGEGTPGREGGRPGDRGFRPPPNPLMTALDADGDYTISAEEIRNAARSLAKLDKNNDGKLDLDELRPDFGGRRPGGFDGPPPRREGEGGRPGGGGRPGEGGRRGERGRPVSSDQFLDRVMSFDENKDGKLSRKEIPERMQRMLDRGDANEDGSLDRDELKKMFEQFQGGRGGQGGRPPRDGGRPPHDGDRPPRDGDERPRRPAVEE